MKTIWYGAKDNDVRFADNQSVLTEQGITNCRSFNVDGEVTGLDLIATQHQSQSSQAQPQG